MSKTKGRTYLIFAIGVLLLIIVFRPVPQIDEEEALAHTGIVNLIYGAGDQDIVFQLADGQEFYINRGLEQGLDIDSLSNLYLDQELRFLYPDYWSLLASEKLKHLSQVEYQGEVIYTEFD